MGLLDEEDASISHVLALGGAMKCQYPVVEVRSAMLTIIYHRLKDGTSYRDLGANCFNKTNERTTITCLVKCLEVRGYLVTRENARATA